MMCEKGHFYHRSCAVAAVDDITACFHCNLLSKEVTVVFGEHKNPVFLSSQKGQKDMLVFVLMIVSRIDLNLAIAVNEKVFLLH